MDGTPKNKSGVRNYGGVSQVPYGSNNQNYNNNSQYNYPNISNSSISANNNFQSSYQGYGSNNPQQIQEDELWNKQEEEYSQQNQQQQFQASLEERYLQPLEKMQSAKWQLRKMGYQEMQQVFNGVPLQGFTNDEIQDMSLEQYGPWLKNIVSEKNLVALSEGLKAIEIFINNFKGSLSNQIVKYYLGDLIENSPLFKPSQQLIAMNIVNNSLLKGDAPFVANEVAKKLESANPKIVQFGLQVIKNALEYQLEIEQAIFVDETMRTLFHSNLALLKNTNKEIRSTSIENLKLIYIQCKESSSEIAKAFLGGQRSVHLKEISEIFKKAKKSVMSFKLIQDNMQKNLEIQKINKQVLTKGQRVDLQAILPDKFFEIPYLLQPAQKKAKLEEMWMNVQKLISSGVQIITMKDGKDYSNIFNILISCLEESNFLIFNESLKCVKNLMKLMKNGIPFPILKHFLTLILDQFRGPKARQYNSAVWQALDDCYFNQCCSYEQLIELMLVNCENEKNLNMRIGCINWLGGRFIPLSIEVIKDSIDLLDIDTQIQSSRGEKLQKLIDQIDKRIEIISKKALNLQLKEACQYLLGRKSNEYFNEYDKENSNNYNLNSVISNQSNNIVATNKQSQFDSKISEQSQPERLQKQPSQKSHIVQPPPQQEEYQPQAQKKQQNQPIKPTSTSPPPPAVVNLLEIGIIDTSPQKQVLDRRQNPSPPIITRKNKMEQQLPAEQQRRDLNQSDSYLNYSDLEFHDENMMKQLESIQQQKNQKPSHSQLATNKQQQQQNQSISNNQLQKNKNFNPILQQNMVPQSNGQNQNQNYFEVPYSQPLPQQNNSKIQQQRNQSSHGASNVSQVQDQFMRGNHLNSSPSLIEETEKSSRNNSNNQRIYNNNNNNNNNNMYPNNNSNNNKNSKQVLQNNNQNYQYNSNPGSNIQSQRHSGHQNAIPPPQTSQFMLNGGNNNNNYMYQNLQQQYQQFQQFQQQQFASVKNPQNGSNNSQYLQNPRNFNSVPQNINDGMQNLNDIKILNDKNLGQQYDNQQLHKRNILFQEGDDFDENNSGVDEDFENHITNHIDQQDDNHFFPENIQRVHTEKSEPKRSRHQDRNDRSRIDSISPIPKQMDQLSSNRHYYASLEGKLNLSDISYPPMHPSSNQGQVLPQAFHDEPWHQKFKEEREKNLKIKEELDRAQQLMEEKEKEQNNLKDSLEVEKRAKIELEEKMEQLKQQQAYQVQQYQLELQKENERQRLLQLNLKEKQKEIKQQQQLSVQIYPKQVNGVCLQEQYVNKSNSSFTQPAKSPLQLVPVKSQGKFDCLKQLQEILLTSEQLYNDLGEDIINHYEGLEEVTDKIEFVIDLKLAIIDQVLLENMSDNNFRIQTQKEIQVNQESRTFRQTDLTKELQTLLDSLLSSKPVGIVLISGIKILNSSVPNDLDYVYAKNEKMMFRLILKCFEKLIANSSDQQDLRVFEVLTEIYKFFKCHPPEALNESLPSLKDLEFIFRSLKSLADQVVSSNPDKAQEFVEFIHSKHRKSIFLDYLLSLVSKITLSNS